MPDAIATIIICTRNRASSLSGTLESVVADSSTVARELIVVDNGSTDDTAAVVERLDSASFPVKLIREATPGLSNARNRGIALAELTTVNLDFMKLYRPQTNVVARPTAGTGRGYSLIGHHEIMIPLLAAALVSAAPPS